MNTYDLLTALQTRKEFIIDDMYKFGTEQRLSAHKERLDELSTMFSVINIIEDSEKEENQP